MRKLCSILLVSVVRKVDSAIHWMAQLVSLILIRWIVIYPVDSAVSNVLNNRGQMLLLFHSSENGEEGGSEREIAC